jgi:pantoate--beta-alanine ligase
VIIVAAPEGARQAARAARARGLRVGLIPTMGALHEGHLSLVRRARFECGYTAASVFVNPAQFGPGEDLSRYPRDLDRDAGLLRNEGVDLLFAPEAGSMYGPSHATWVDVAGLGDGLCGPHRPGHFRGVATIVAKLFNLLRPDAAYFGAKDAQQAAIIRRMAADLDFGLDVVVCPTVRAPDGLALSSRNFHLTAAERTAAPALWAALREAAAAVTGGGVRSGAAVRSLVVARLAATPFKIQYVEVVDAESLRPIERLAGEILVAVAAHLGATRLIDNVTVKVPEGTSQEAGR